MAQRRGFTVGHRAGDILSSRWQGAVSGLALLCMLPHHAGAQSLESALDSVYDNNPVLEAERANLRATDEKLPQALANWRPTVTISVDQGVSSAGSASGASIAPPPGYSNTLGVAPQQYGLTIAEPLYRGGRTEAQKSQALNLIRAERAQLLATEQTVFLAAATDYLNVVLADATVDLDKNYETLLQKEFDEARSKFQAGELTQTDVSQAQAAYANAIAQEQSAEGSLNVANAAFLHDVGFRPLKLHQPAAVPLLPASKNNAIQAARENNPSVTSAGFKVSAQRDDIRLIRGALLPTVTLNGNINQGRAPDTGYEQSDVKEVYAELSVPLYDGGTTYSDSREAQQTLTQLMDQYDESQRVAALNASQSWDQMQSQRAQILALRTAIDADRLSLDGVRSEQAVGARTELDVLNAEQTLYQAQLSLVQARHDEMLSEFSVKAAVGELTASALGIRVEPYDPDVNLSAVRNKWFGFGTGEQAVEPESAPEPAPLRSGGYYDVGEPGAAAPPVPSKAGDYIEAQSGPPAPQRVAATPVVNAANLAAFNDYDHDLVPPAGANKWMDPSEP